MHCIQELNTNRKEGNVWRRTEGASHGAALADQVTRPPPPAVGLLGAAAEGGVVAVVMMVRRRGRGRVSERGRDYRGFDWDDPGVHHLTVHLHHHLVTALRRVIHRIYRQKQQRMREREKFL